MKKQVKKVKAWIVLDCGWHTIRDFAIRKKDLIPSDCPKCQRIKCTITYTVPRMEK